MFCSPGLHGKCLFCNEKQLYIVIVNNACNYQTGFLAGDSESFKHRIAEFFQHREEKKTQITLASNNLLLAMIAMPNQR